MSKSIWKSKTLWLNVIGVALFFLPHLPLDPKIMAEVLAAVNVVNRFVTQDPVHFFTPEDK